MADKYTTALYGTVSLTLDQYKKGMWDQVMKGSVLLYELGRQGFIKYYDGGRMIDHEVEMDVNPTVGLRNAKSTVPVQEYEPFRVIAFPWSNVNGSLTIYDEDARINRGPAALANHAELLVSNTQRSLKESMASLIFSDGSTGIVAGDPPFLGLAAMCSASNSYAWVYNRDNSQSALNRSTAGNEWWQAIVNSNSAAISMEGTNGIRHQIGLQTLGIRDVKVDLGVTTQSLYEALIAQYSPNERYIDTELAKVLTNISIDGTRFCWDTYCTASALYLLSTQFIEFSVDSQCKGGFKLGDWVRQDPTPSAVRLIGVQGQLTCTTPRHQGAMTALTT